MQLKIPKNTGKYFWTEHSIFKMRQYGLSEQKVRNVIRNFDRREEGIVKNTVAVMQPVSPKIIDGKKIWKQEIWVMYQLRQGGVNPKFQISNFPVTAGLRQGGGKQIQNSKFKIQNSANQKIRIISTWRYPGVSPERDPIPEEILQELSEL